MEPLAITILEARVVVRMKRDDLHEKHPAEGRRSGNVTCLDQFMVLEVRGDWDIRISGALVLILN